MLILGVYKLRVEIDSGKLVWAYGSCDFGVKEIIYRTWNHTGL